ncbi:HNH endonuclease [Streptomyces sp. PKU-EA00015]|uniref:HNH endonuclease signature motif containing protein n=1 Tax=Streptomyces sp. PKU-EA00015 TaxID=2748326 RepID=UPI0015A0DBF4|nr:HNH endonuclease signature motif containing protein [Streptomyces sp. PKU-EA00015]NWF30089.1 HNH endonuclease [Streptomyces sp. PKU-EA00015]
MSQVQRYTRERLAEAAERCADIDEVITFLGTRPYGKLRRYLLRRFAHFGIDVSHFRHCGPHTAKTRPAADRLRTVVADSFSVAEALRRLGRPDNGQQRALLRRWLTEEGVDTSHFLGQAHQRGKPGTTPRRKAEALLVKHDGKRRTRSAPLRRALHEIGVPEQCDECGTGPVWLGRPMTLEVDHINGDWSDDRAENLRLLCPNCHAITGTWCRGSKRQASRRDHPHRRDRLPANMTYG